MGRSKKTDYAILGLLSLEPMSGYDMRAFISQSIGFFWQESYGQIYPALKRLREAGLVTREVQETAGRPDRHVYSITDSGQDHLEKWLQSETEPEQIRHELLLKLFFGPMAAPEVHKQQIESLLEHQLNRLEAFRHVEEEGMLKEHESSPYYPYWYSTLRFGIHVTRARVDWCRETLQMLQRIDGSRFDSKIQTKTEDEND